MYLFLYLFLYSAASTKIILKWDLLTDNSASICRVVIFIVGISRCIGGGGVRQSESESERESGIESQRGCCGKGGPGGSAIVRLVTVSSEFCILLLLLYGL